MIETIKGKNQFGRTIEPWSVASINQYRDVVLVSTFIEFFTSQKLKYVRELMEIMLLKII